MYRVVRVGSIHRPPDELVDDPWPQECRGTGRHVQSSLEAIAVLFTVKFQSKDTCFGTGPPIVMHLGLADHPGSIEMLLVTSAKCFANILQSALLPP